MNDKRIELSVLGLSYSQAQTGAYAIILSEKGGKRRIPVVIGGIEAQSIAIKLEGLKPPRPLTHDLFTSFARNFSIHLVEAFIYKLEEGIFYSELMFVKDGNIVRMDSRTSDAVALAIRFNCPVFTSEEIMAKAGIIIESDDKQEGDIQFADQPEVSTVAQLKKKLKEAIDSENYERASELRDEIRRLEERQ